MKTLYLFLKVFKIRFLKKRQKKITSQGNTLVADRTEDGLGTDVSFCNVKFDINKLIIILFSTYSPHLHFISPNVKEFFPSSNLQMRQF